MALLVGLLTGGIEGVISAGLISSGAAIIGVCILLLRGLRAPTPGPEAKL